MLHYRRRSIARNLAPGKPLTLLSLRHRRRFHNVTVTGGKRIAKKPALIEARACV